MRDSPVDPGGIRVRSKYDSFGDYVRSNRQNHGDDAESVSSTDSGYLGNPSEVKIDVPYKSYRKFLDSYGTLSYKKVAAPIVDKDQKDGNDQKNGKQTNKEVKKSEIFIPITFGASRDLNDSAPEECETERTARFGDGAKLKPEISLKPVLHVQTVRVQSAAPTPKPSSQGLLVTSEEFPLRPSPTPKGFSIQPGEFPQSAPKKFSVPSKELPQSSPKGFVVTSKEFSQQSSAPIGFSVTPEIFLETAPKGFSFLLNTTSNELSQSAPKGFTTVPKELLQPTKVFSSQPKEFFQSARKEFSGASKELSQPSPKGFSTVPKEASQPPTAALEGFSIQPQEISRKDFSMVPTEVSQPSTAVLKSSFIQPQELSPKVFSTLPLEHSQPSPSPKAFSTLPTPTPPPPPKASSTLPTPTPPPLPKAFSTLPPIPPPPPPPSSGLFQSSSPRQGSSPILEPPKSLSSPGPLKRTSKPPTDTITTAKNSVIDEIKNKSNSLTLRKAGYIPQRSYAFTRSFADGDGGEKSGVGVYSTLPKSWRSQYQQRNRQDQNQQKQSHWNQQNQVEQNSIPKNQNVNQHNQNQQKHDQVHHNQQNQGEQNKIPKIHNQQIQNTFSKNFNHISTNDQKQNTTRPNHVNQINIHLAHNDDQPMANSHTKKSNALNEDQPIANHRQYNHKKLSNAEADTVTRVPVDVNDVNMVQIDKNDPTINKLVYDTYRDFLKAYNKTASSIVATMPNNAPVQDKTIADRLNDIESRGGLGHLSGRTMPKEDP